MPENILVNQIIALDITFSKSFKIFQNFYPVRQIMSLLLTLNTFHILF